MGEFNYIAHHGIIGQKWGIRRYQNPDGTRTEAGKKRYSGKELTAEQKRKRAQIKRTAKDVAKVAAIAGATYLSMHPEILINTIDKIAEGAVSSGKTVVNKITEDGMPIDQLYSLDGIPRSYTPGYTKGYTDGYTKTSGASPYRYKVSTVKTANQNSGLGSKMDRTIRQIQEDTYKSVKNTYDRGDRSKDTIDELNRLRKELGY